MAVSRLRRVMVSGGLVVGVLVGCSGAAVSAAERVVLGAATHTYAEGSARVALVVGFEGPVSAVVGATAGEEFAGEGVIDFRGRRSQISLALPAGLAGGGTLQAIVDGGFLFVNPPGLMGSLPGAQPWTRFDPDDAVQRKLLGLLRQLLVVLDPRAALELLDGAGGDTEEVGTETIRGTPTTRYRATVDLGRAAEKLSGPAREAFERDTEPLARDALSVDVWTDRQGQARRIQLSIRVPDGGTIEASLEFFDFGVDVEITVPTDDQTAPPAQLATVDPCLIGEWRTVVIRGSAPGYTDPGQPLVTTMGGSGVTLSIDEDGAYRINFSGSTPLQGTIGDGRPLSTTVDGEASGSISARNGRGLVSNMNPPQLSATTALGAEQFEEPFMISTGEVSYMCTPGGFVEQLPGGERTWEAA